MDTERAKINNMNNERKSTVCACVGATLLGCLASSAFGIAIYAAYEVDNLEDEITKVPVAAIGERFTAPAFGCEGVNWDVEKERFIIGSVFTDKIYSLVPGQNTSALPAAVFETGFGNLGVYLDQNNERNILWSASTGWSRRPPITEASPVQASIMRYDLSTGMVMEEDVSFLRLDPARFMVLNDVVADDEGTAYFSNSFDGQIIAAKLVGGSLLTKSVTLPDFKSNIGSFGLNGMEYYDDALYVAFVDPSGSNAESGIYRIADPDDTPIYERNSITLGNDIVKLEPGVPFVDGMRFHPDHKRLFVTSGTSVYELRSDDDFKSSAYVARAFGDVCEETDAPNFENEPRTLAYVPEDDAVFTMCSDFTGPGRIVRVI